MELRCHMGLPFINNPKYLDPSYKMDLHFWDCFGKKNTSSYNRRNMVACMHALFPWIVFPVFDVNIGF